MCPVGVGSSEFTSTTTLKTGEAKLWILLVGVNEYQDKSLPSLRYPALDCQGLGEALFKATQGFPNKEVIVHHDFAAQPPTLEMIRGSLHKIVSQSRSPDSILLYFSGHGMLEPNTQQAVLCLADTHRDDLLGTGLGMQQLLQILGSSRANQQLLCLDTCHSGDMRLVGKNRGSARDGNSPEALPNPTTQLMNVLRKRAAQSKGFCALLSCDEGQQSWEFPELGHGVFTYYLMRGLLGEAADSHGFIEADGLYKYVYRQTLQYINKLNQQLHLVNQQKLNRGESQLYPEYPLQTPKRILEGVGELIVGYKPVEAECEKQRRAVVIDGLSSNETTINLSLLFAGAGGFEVEHFPQKGKNLSDIRGKIQGFTRWQSESKTNSSFQPGGIKNTLTALLYLRGYVEEIEDGEAWLILSDGMRLSRSWLRQELRRAQQIQQIIILDLITSDSSSAGTVENWIEDLQCATDHGQCLIVGVTPAHKPQLFSQTLLETLAVVNPQVGLPVAKWITQLQQLAPTKGINLHTWLSGIQAVIDILPGNISTIVHDFREQKRKEGLGNSGPPLGIRGNGEWGVGGKISSSSPGGLFLSPEHYASVEKLLKQWLGSIAPRILQKEMAQAANCQELVENLASYLVPQQQQQFKKQTTAILKISTVSPLAAQSARGETRKSQIIDAQFVSKCERELAYSIGPIASFLVKEVLQSHPQISLEEFVKNLANKIPQPKKAMEFQRRIFEL